MDIFNLSLAQGSVPTCLKWVVGLIRRRIEGTLCQKNNLFLNASKTKEMIADP